MADDGEETPQDDGGDPPAPDAQADEIARLTEERDAAQSGLTAATDIVRAALRTANPDLPESVFAATDINTLQSSVDNAIAIRDSVRASMNQDGEAPPPPTPRTPAAAGSQRDQNFPDNVTGPARIREAMRRLEQ